MPDDYERVDHPTHYRGPKGIECIDVIEEGTSFNLMTAIKYIWRVEWGDKPDSPKVEDLHKAVWYLQREILRLRIKRGEVVVFDGEDGSRG